MQMTDVEITKAAAKYMGKPALATAVLALLAVVVYGVLFAVTVTGGLSIWISFPLVAYLVYVTYTPLHEAVHNNIAGTDRSLRWLNDFTGYLVASVLGVSFTMHKSAHMSHHRHTNVAGKDPDLIHSGNQFYDLIVGGSKMVAGEYKDYFTRVYPNASRREKSIVIVELLTFVGWRAALATVFPFEVLMLGILANVVGVTLLGYIFAWVVHTPFNQTERFKDTATILLPRLVHQPITMLWLWQNYHSIHHLFPKVPFFQYQKLFAEICNGMQERGAPILKLQLNGRVPVQREHPVMQAAH